MPTTAARRIADPAPSPNAAPPRELLPALLVLLTAWSLLATQALLTPRIGRPAAVAVSFAAVTVLVIATRRREPARAPGRAAALGVLGALAGFVSFPAWILLIGGIGSALGLRSVPPPPRPDDPLLLVAVLGLSPVFEELLYRERLLLALREHIGAGLAIAVSSVCFALPHLEPWSLLATGCVGLGLGVLMLSGRSLALCIGLHAGLNLAAVVCGIPPARFALPAALAFVCSAGVLGVGLLAARAGGFGVFTTDAH
jgi:membrane protease YdiL (CAAX protease family)